MQQLISQGRTILESKYVHGGFVTEGETFIGVNVCHDEVNVLLREIVERGAFGKNIAKEFMVAFHMRFLKGSHGITIKKMGTAQFAFELEGERICEFTAIVGEQDGKKASKVIVTQGVIQEVDFVNSGLRGICIAQEGQHQLRGGKNEGEKDFAALFTNDAVHFDFTEFRVLGHKQSEISEGTSGTARPVDFMNWLALSWLKFAYTPLI